MLLLLLLLGFTAVSRSQSEIDIRTSSFVLGRQYYNNKDYLNAYKYLLVYKYTYYDKLTMPENSTAFKSLNQAIKFSEDQLKIGLSGSSTFVGSGYYMGKEEAKQKVQVKEKPPILEDTHF